MHSTLRNDAHIHITPASVDPNGTADRYLKVRDRYGIGITAIVTPGTMGWDNETSFAIASSDPQRFRVIARTDLQAVQAASDVKILMNRGAAGLRITLMGHDDISWLNNGAIDAPIAVLAEQNAVIELHADAHQLKDVDVFARRWTRVPIVIDHMGRPNPDAGASHDYFQDFLRLSQHPHVVAKTPNSPFFSRTGFPFHDLTAFYEHTLEAFGTHRLLWSSDWPLSVQDNPYDASFEPLHSVLGGQSNTDATRIWQTNFLDVFGETAHYE